MTNESGAPSDTPQEDGESLGSANATTTAEKRPRQWWARVTQRPGLLWATVGLVGTLVIVGASLLVVLEEPLASANEVVAIGDVLVGGTFLLAFVAGVVALLAYRDATRRSMLVTTWSLNGAELGEAPLKFHRDSTVDLGVNGRIPLKKAKLRIRVENTGNASGRYVMVVIRMEGIIFDSEPSKPEWSVYEGSKGWQVEWRPEARRRIYPGAWGWRESVELKGMSAVQNRPDTRWSRVVTFADDSEPQVRQVQIEVAD